MLESYLDATFGHLTSNTQLQVMVWACTRGNALLDGEDVLGKKMFEE